ncbi:MAG: DUF434 domain-containing protein [Candidatus Eremiobacteraeota bacterium]|nr:DUF434 domain-containing protein [Candidatus Eremiobacteraeota bacterium]
MHRGPHPEDPQLFHAQGAADFATALEDYSWLLSRGYSRPAGLTLVGDRFQLTQRQRVALGRCACSQEAQQERRRKQVHHFESLHIDGLNALTTVEAALAGGVVLRGKDGCYRDMASFHGNYRMVEEAPRAAQLIGIHLQGRPAHWLLDRPVSNTGRLAALLRDLAAERNWPWTVELVADPDPLLKTSSEVVATSDSAILDGCTRWYNLARAVVEGLPEVWLFP